MSLNVFVAESSTQARKNLIKSLQEIGVRRFTEATNGPEAIKHYEQGQFDLLFIEWELQGQQGQSLVQEIRQLDSEVPIIATTTSDTNSAQEAERAGASEFLVQPTTTEILREKYDKFAGASTR